MSWRIAESLKRLREQVNALHPGRDKTSDGGIGDEKHASRSSDHNPWVKDGKVGVVTAIDIDEDLGGNAKLQVIIDAICASKDKRVKYIIYEGRITVKGSNLQQWKKYTGPNRHDHHAHISVNSDKTNYDSIADWKLSGGVVAEPTTDPIYRYVVVPGDSLWGISRRFSTSVNEIKRLNGLTSDVIKVGQILRVR